MVVKAARNAFDAKQLIFMAKIYHITHETEYLIILRKLTQSAEKILTANCQQTREMLRTYLIILLLPCKKRLKAEAFAFLQPS
jgi:hypothetical protein